jgi:hypothetical protein
MGMGVIEMVEGKYFILNDMKNYYYCQTGLRIPEKCAGDGLFY